MLRLPAGILLHINQNLTCPSFSPYFDFGASILHIQTEFLLASILTKGFGSVSDLLDFIYGGSDFEFMLRSVKVGEDSGFIGLRKRYQLALLAHAVGSPCSIYGQKGITVGDRRPGKR
jgi:hypothetical protein